MISLEEAVRVVIMCSSTNSGRVLEDNLRRLPCVRSETGVREAVIEECAALIDPGPNPPCGCLRPGSYGGCDCGNVGNTQQEESYWTSKGDAERIRTLKGKP